MTERYIGAVKGACQQLSVFRPVQQAWADTARRQRESRGFIRGGVHTMGAMAAALRRGRLASPDVAAPELSGPPGPLRPRPVAITPAAGLSTAGGNAMTARLLAREGPAQDNPGEEPAERIRTQLGGGQTLSQDVRSEAQTDLDCTWGTSDCTATPRPPPWRARSGHAHSPQGVTSFSETASTTRRRPADTHCSPTNWHTRSNRTPARSAAVRTRPGSP
jgi:hypothetical protein